MIEAKDIAKAAYEAVRMLDAVARGKEELPEWDRLSDVSQQIFINKVNERYNKRTNPYAKSVNEMPLEQRKCDELFYHVVDSMAYAAGSSLESE